MFEEKESVLFPILVDNLKHAIGMWKAYAKRKFPIYYDTDKNIAKKVLNQEWKIFKYGRMPAMLIINKSGIIEYAHYGTSMHDIPGNEEILNVLDKINSE